MAHRRALWTFIRFPIHGESIYPADARLPTLPILACPALRSIDSGASVEVRPGMPLVGSGQAHGSTRSAAISHAISTIPCRERRVAPLIPLPDLVASGQPSPPMPSYPSVDRFSLAPCRELARVSLTNAEQTSSRREGATKRCERPASVSGVVSR